jgi:prepilin-type N-terminal cleavage/methylation domain-containing protein
LTKERRTCGFSLIEVLFSLAILSLAAVALGSVMLSTFRAQDNVTNSAVARALASRVLERAADELPKLTAAVEEDFWDSDYDVTPWRSGEEKVGAVTYRYEVKAKLLQNNLTGMPVGSAAGATENDLKLFNVTVFWHPESGLSGPGRGMQRVTASRLVNRVKR